VLFLLLVYVLLRYQHIDLLLLLQLQLMLPYYRVWAAKLNRTGARMKRTS
jgi:hypothetical protein